MRGCEPTVGSVVNLFFHTFHRRAKGDCGNVVKLLFQHFHDRRQGDSPPRKKGEIMHQNCKVSFDGCNYVAFVSKKEERSRSFKKTPPAPISVQTSNGTGGVKSLTTKEYFNEVWGFALNRHPSERKAYVKEKMRPFITSSELDLQHFVDHHVSRMYRNKSARSLRMRRKAFLQNFNYFVTFTYDDKKCSENEFYKGIRTSLKNLVKRYAWKGMGAWEHGEDTGRLHFHAVFDIRDMPGMLVEVEEYNIKTKRKERTVMSTYFLEKFGRNEFRKIEDENGLNSAITYILKYIEKNSERIYYTRGLPQFFLCDIKEDDVITNCGADGKKMILFADFELMLNGKSYGPVDKDKIKQFPKVM